MSEKKRVVDHLDVFLGSRHSWGVKPDESDYEDALAFMERLIPAELGWVIDGKIIYQEASDDIPQ